MKKHRIIAAVFVRDLRVGLDDAALMQKYLSEVGLRRVLCQFADKRVTSRTPGGTAGLTSSVFTIQIESNIGISVRSVLSPRCQ